MIVFFSGTGNSRYCADILGQRLSDTVVDAAPYLRRGEGAELASERPWVFVCPTYAWKIPRVFEGFLRNSRFSGHRQAYFVMTCGGEIGAAAAELEPLCTAMGLQYQGVFPVKMADNYLILFPSPKDEEIRRGLQNARVCMEQAARTIAAQTAAPAVSWGWLDRLKSGPVNQGMYRFYIKPKKIPRHRRLHRMRRLSAPLSAEQHPSGGQKTPVGTGLHPLHGLSVRLSRGSH